MALKRLVHEDEKGLWISVDGWVLRPRYHYTVAKAGTKVNVIGGTDPIRAKFGSLAFDSGHRERWTIYNSETIETRTKP